MRFFFFAVPNTTPDPESEPKPAKDDDDLLDHRIQQFDELGFNYLEALALAWNKVSPSDVRERFLKRGASKEQVLSVFLEEE